MEYSLFMIKPCAYEKKDEILEIISKKLNVLFTRDINLDEKFLNKLYKNEEIYQKELQELYDPNNLFKNKRDTSSTSTAVIEYKESIFTKIRNWIKRIFKAG